MRLTVFALLMVFASCATLSDGKSWKDYLAPLVECAQEPLTGALDAVVSDVEKALKGGVAFDSAEWKTTATNLGTKYGWCLFGRAVTFLLSKLEKPAEPTSSVGGLFVQTQGDGRVARENYLKSAFSEVKIHLEGKK